LALTHSNARITNTGHKSQSWYPGFVDLDDHEHELRPPQPGSGTLIAYNVLPSIWSPTTDKEIDMGIPNDVPLFRPLLKWVNKEHVSKTIGALIELGHDPHALPNNFFRRNVQDQRRYFEVILKLSYCNTCRSPRPDPEMFTNATCTECHELKEAAWMVVRQERNARLLDSGTHLGYKNRYQRLKAKRLHVDFKIAKLIDPNREMEDVGASIPERPRKPATHDNAWDILARADTREPHAHDQEATDKKD
jgi:hypothetical protein